MKKIKEINFTEKQFQKIIRDYNSKGYAKLGQIISTRYTKELLRRVEDLMMGKIVYKNMFFKLDDSMGNYFNSVDNSESAIKHFDEVISITNATLKNSKLSYKDRSTIISNKMTAMVGKNTALHRIDPDSERKKNLALKLVLKVC